MGDLAQEMWDMAQHNFEACCRLDKRLGNNYSAYRYAEQRIAELEFKVKLGDQFKERAHCVAAATQAAWEETVDELKARIAELEADRNAWRESAEQLGRQVASLTHNIPTDIPLLGGGDE